MILKKIYLLLALLLFTSFYFSLKAQNSDLINASLSLLNSVNNGCDCCNTLNMNQPFYEGKIILKDNTVYTGKISVNQPFENKMITILNIDNNYTPIDNALIKEVHLEHTENKNLTETKFINLNSDERLYRLIYLNESLVTVYDSSNKLFDDLLVGRIIIKENNTLTDTWNFWSSGPKKDLINYINERDFTNFKQRDFESLNDLFAKL
ncbi:hypothetical protein [Winogradskyella helgolandensis]|uniref:hypothetical protein n=1 Tax=Winogradskyella helgolandensis TaxID=2697010 RepID=UPI0015CAF31D|nr:hypothetical protein [Winogradskyella helgolandensis]